MNNVSSSSSSDSDGEINLEEAQSQNESVQVQTHVRTKRSAPWASPWCGVTSRTLPAGPFLEWPPKPEDVADGSWRRNLRPTSGPKPKFGNRMQLYSKTGYNLAVSYEKVYGTQEDNDVYTYLELVNAGRPGSVRILGMISKMYIAMDHKGRLHAEANETNATVFEEGIHNIYNTYLSLNNAHKGWYLGIKKSGKFKNGKRTGHKQKACLFLPRRGKFE